MALPMYGTAFVCFALINKKIINCVNTNKRPGTNARVRSNMFIPFKVNFDKGFWD